MYANIVVALDGSKRAERVLPYACAFSVGFGSPLNLARVIPPLPPELAAVSRAATPAMLTATLETLAQDYLKEVAEGLTRNGVECDVVDLRTLQPLDTAAVLESVMKTGKACIVHEDNLTGGVGAEIAAIIAREAFEYLDGPVYRVAAPDVPSFPYSPPLEEFCLPSPTKIVQALRELTAY